MAKIEGVKEVCAAFEKLKTKYGNEKDPSVTVGFTQNYAVYVHEDMEAEHHVGQAKFLEQPAREGRKTMVNIVKKAVKNGANLLEGLLLAGLWLQRSAQKLVPVLTGALKASAFTAPTNDLNTAVEAAANLSQEKRQAAVAKKLGAKKK